MKETVETQASGGTGLSVPATPTATTSQAVMMVPCDPNSLVAANGTMVGDPIDRRIHQLLK